MLNSKWRDFLSKLWRGVKRNCKWRDETKLTNTLEIRACILLWYCDVNPWCVSVSLSPRYLPCLPENALSTVKFCSWPFSHLRANVSLLTSISLIARQSKQGLLVLKILKILWKVNMRTRSWSNLKTLLVPRLRSLYGDFSTKVQNKNCTNLL